MERRNHKTSRDVRGSRRPQEKHPQEEDKTGGTGDIITTSETVQAIGRIITRATKRIQKENVLPSPVSKNDRRKFVDQEILITNNTSDNPSRSHIPRAGSRKRPSQNAERFNRTLSRDPRWVAHITAAKPRREAAPARLPIPRKRISEQRQIFWPNGPMAVPPPRCGYRAKKKHIGLMSPLVYCSYPPNRPAEDQVEENSVPQPTTSNIVTNGEILAMMFHRPSATDSAKKTGNGENYLNVGASDSNRYEQRREIDNEPLRTVSKRKLTREVCYEANVDHLDTSKPASKRARQGTCQRQEDGSPSGMNEMASTKDRQQNIADQSYNNQIASRKNSRVYRAKRNAASQNLCRIAQATRAKKRKMEADSEEENWNINDNGSNSEGCRDSNVI